MMFRFTEAPLHPINNSPTHTAAKIPLLLRKTLSPFCPAVYWICIELIFTKMFPGDYYYLRLIPPGQQESSPPLPAAKKVDLG